MTNFRFSTNRYIITAFFTSILFFSAFSFANAATYYVSPNGSDSNSGTINAPFKTIQNAANIVNPGDVVIVKDGTYTDTDGDGKGVYVTRGGTSTNWVTFKSENKWGAVLDGQLGTTRYGIFVGPNANYIHFENFEIMEFNLIGMIFPNQTAGDNWIIYGNHIHNIGLRSKTSQSEMDNFLYGKDAIYIGEYSDGHIIDSNVMHHIGRKDDPASWNSRSGQNQIEEYKHDQTIYIYKNVKNITVINNIFHDNHHGWYFKVSPGDSNIKFVNNTVYGANENLIGVYGLGGAINVWGTQTNIMVQNNIFFDPTNGYIIWTYPLNGSDGISNFAIENNLTNANQIFSPNITQGNWVSSNNILSSNPLFVDGANNNYRLQANSFAINAGLATNAPSYDHDGNLRPNNSIYDIGAYEYTGSVPSSPTCNSFTYSCGACQQDSTMSCSVLTSSPSGCTGGTPVTTQSCTYIQPPTNNTITALKTLSQITTDGNLTESVWNQASSLTFSNPSRSDNAVTVSTLYDDTNLYFAYQVTDSNIEATDTNLWQDDGAEIYIDTQNNKSTSMDSNDYHFMTNINDLASVGTITVKTTTHSTGSGQATGYTQEIAIPWTTINITPTSNMTMGLLLGNNDRDNNQSSQFDWLDLIETGSYARPNLWGDLILSSQTVGTQPTLQGDLNQDSTVNALDWSIMNNAWGTADATADLNNDGIVNTIDFSILNGEWGM